MKVTIVMSFSSSLPLGSKGAEGVEGEDKEGFGLKNQKDLNYIFLYFLVFYYFWDICVGEMF